ncbi:MAG: hypothetical protein H6884_09820 [Rhodobiaceae bacterium]|nr:hypothetical protein [Rhodobiaceae bacterium]
MAVLDYLSSKAKTWSNEVWDGLLRAVDARFKPLEEQLDIQRATTDAIVAKGLNVIEAELAPVVLQGEDVLIGIQGVKTDADAVYAALVAMRDEGIDPAHILTSALARFTSDAEMAAKVTQADIDAAIDALKGGAGSALDTLAEIAAALDNDEDFAATMIAALATKADEAATAAALATKALATDVYPNLLRNPRFEVDTRGNAAGVTNTAHVVDGWRMGYNNDVTTQTLSRTTGKDGEYALRYTVTTGSNASIAAAQHAYILTAIEGYMFKAARFGTPDAQDLVVSFWARSNTTGTFALAARNASVTRSYVTEFTIVADNTWEEITITVPGDTSGTWETTTNIGMTLCVSMACGSTYQATADAWSAGNYIGTPGQDNFLATNGNWLEISTPMVSVGGPIPWNPRPRDLEEVYCGRYARMVGIVPVSLVSTTDAYIYADMRGMRTLAPSCTLLVGGVSAIHHPLVNYYNITSISACQDNRIAVVTSTSSGGRALAETNPNALLLTAEMI